jgi:putative nucleotidyltransferase with HDIG domain
MLEYYWRPSVRKILVRLLNWTDSSVIGQPAVLRDRGQRFWQREISLSPLVVALVSVMTFFVFLLFEIGLSWLKITGLVLFLSMSVAYLVVYLRYEHSELLADSEAMALFGLICISAVLAMQLSKKWFSPLATPLAAFTLLTGLLLSRNLALMVGIVLSLILGILNDFSLEYFLVSLFSTFTVAVFLPAVRNRSDLSKMGLKVAATNVLVILVIHFFRLWPFRTLEVNIGWGIASGFGSALIVLGTLPYLETFFSRTTNIKLLELADFNRPLLKRLMLEAPGTYHHSLIMASLAEQAAEAIGDNSLLARVGAYYHDIGKLSNPEYFIENQQPHLNPHDPLTPTMSSLVVISHVKEGKALSQQYNLDKVIVDCIEQHHGTSLIHYFYHRALEQNAEIKADSFRYSGPKPKSKVTAILMIADAVEAASRTIEEPTPGRLRDTVEKVINNKFTDGQFAECPITLHDLKNIADSMVSTLSGIYHARIEYQETSGKNGK